jgi:hypothetical protein
MRYGALSEWIYPHVRWAFIAVCLALGGCGNAYEHITVGEWQEVGKAEPPIPVAKGGLVVTILTEGIGPTASPGDLVKARVRTITSPNAQIVWIWTGREPGPGNWQQLAADRELFGDLGLGRTRLAFIGRRLNEQFEIQLEPGAQHGDEFPLRGIIDDRLARLNTAVKLGGRWVAPREWPALPLAGGGMGEGAAQIEIINICKARLFRRTATLDQRGAVWSTGDAGYPTVRKGTLGWTAIDAQCPEPDGHVRFQAGPFYAGGGASDRTRLANWSGSYVRLRPPEKYPEEWAEQR